MSAKLGELFSNILGKETDEALGTSSVLSCDIDAEKRRLNLKLQSNRYIKAETLFNFKSDCIKGLKLKGLDVDIKYSRESFCIEALLDIIEKLKTTSALFSGYLNRAEYSLNEKNLDRWQAS